MVALGPTSYRERATEVKPNFIKETNPFHKTFDYTCSEKELGKVWKREPIK